LSSNSRCQKTRKFQEDEGVEVFGVAIIRYYDPEEGGMVRTYRDVRGYYNPEEGVTDWWYDD